MSSLGEDIIFVEKAFSATTFNIIKNVLFSAEFLWSYLETTGLSENQIVSHNLKCDTTFSFARKLFGEGSRFSEHSYIIEAGLINMLDNCGLNISELIRIRAGLITKTAENNANAPHIDHVAPHLTALVYLNTTNAPTYLYDIIYDAHSNQDTIEFMSNKKLKVYKTIPCIENTAVIFNGHRYHASSTPTDASRRIVLNFNFTVK